MALFVADASVTLAWCFEDEDSSFTDGLLDRLRQGDRIVVPAHWPTEVLNGLLVASRRKRIKPEQPALFWDELSRLPIEKEPPLGAMQGKIALALSVERCKDVARFAYRAFNRISRVIWNCLCH